MAAHSQRASGQFHGGAEAIDGALFLPEGTEDFTSHRMPLTASARRRRGTDTASD